VCPAAHLARLCDLAVVRNGLLEDGLQIVGGLVDLAQMPVGESTPVERLCAIGTDLKHLKVKGDRNRS